MRKRLYVRLEETQLQVIRRLARREGLSVSEWVRRALRAARRETHRSDAGKKLQVIRAAAGHSFPTTDIGEMLRQIGSGDRVSSR
jgi:hypothetical protein